MDDHENGAARNGFVDVSGSYGHLACFQGLLPLILKTNPHAYLSTSDGSDPLNPTWLSLAFAGMENLRHRRSAPIRTIAIIGTGSGLDAIGLSTLFSPEQIIASDLHPLALDAARWNIATYARRGTHCEVRQSDLFRSYPPDSRFDLVYENLPNVPDDTDLLGGIRAASCFGPAAYRSEPVSDRYLLTLHYNCLIEARDHLQPDGWIVATIGGRVPWNVIQKVFARAGFEATILHFALKTQTEPEVVLDGYARAERNGSPPFIYYHPGETCGRILARHAADAPEARAAQVEVINAELESCRVTACEALSLHRRGEKVFHSVYVVGGTPAPETDLRS